MDRLLTALATVIFAASPASADIINVPADQPTIQAGIDAAASGDEVVVAPGTYLESVDLGGKAITLRSTDPADRAVVVATVIDGTGHDYAVRCVSGEGAGTVLSGLVMTGGALAGMLIDASSPTVNACSFAGSGDDGVHVLNDSDPAFHACSFTSNPEAGMVIDASSPTVRGGFFTNNGAQGMLVTNGSPTVNDCAFSNNGTDGMLVNDGSPTVTGSSFIANGTLSPATGVLVGHGMQVNGLASNATVTDCFFSIQQRGIELNGASATVTDSRFSGHNRGLGIFRSAGGDLTVDRCSFTDNEFGLQIISGAGDTTTVTRSTFSWHDFASIQVQASGGVLQISDCTISDSSRDETASNFLAGGLAFWFSTRDIDVTVTRTTFTNNLRSAIEIGSVQSGTLTITESVFRNNSFPGSESGGIRSRNGSEIVVPVVSGSVFFANTPNDTDVVITDGGGNAFGSPFPPPAVPVAASTPEGCSRADVTTSGANPGDPEDGVPDGAVTVEDLTFFVELWLQGCP